ncbi:phage antirepressor KilAC domain-containing protein [Flavobacteriaceae bacterium GSB9]|nr:phage antirepressor KilAC domain-containing protein [Flavobacteriaceae bacterium GSB9]
MKLISTTQLAKIKSIETKDLFNQLANNGWIYKKDDKWQLTQDGRVAGGDTKYTPKYGEYVVWPSNLDLDQSISAKELLNPTKIGEHFKISNRRVNLYLSEIGWINKNLDGWNVTKAGEKNGGHQMESKNGVPYALWDESILNNKHLVRTIKIGEGHEVEQISEYSQTGDEEMDFRLKIKAEKRTSDGHYVRSRAELLIDNFFYNNGIVHAYEKKLNIDEDMYCDFYLPENKIYVEFWGMSDPKYLERKKRKLELYSKYNFILVELDDSDLENLDENLQSKLRKVGLVVH